MLGEKDFKSLDKDQGWAVDSAGFGAIRIALLFGSAAVALALVLIPVVNGVTGASYAGGEFGLDRMTTGSVGGGNQYTIRRSVLQSNPTAVCIIHNDGRQAGDC